MSGTQLFCVYSQAPDVEPLTWWSAPGYDDARRQVLDLLDVVPAPYTRDGRTWWLHAALLARPDDSSPNKTAGDDVEEIGQLLRGLRQDREGVTNSGARSVGDAGRGDDDRIPLLSMLLLRVFRCAPSATLALHIGTGRDATGNWGPDPETFGLLWHADLTASAWTIVRAFSADMARWSYPAPAAASG